MNPHQIYPATPVAMLKSFWRNRRLFWQMTKREIVGRYRGSIMGLAWSFFNPMLMLAVYTFVFSVIFNFRWNNSGAESKTEFALILFVGMIIQGIFTECINRSPILIISNINYVKKVVFPLEILSWVIVASSLFNALISVIVLLLAQVILNHVLMWTVLLFPIVLLPLILIVIGFSWILASLGVFLRDMGQIVGIVTTILMYLSPVFYPISAVPKRYQIWIKLNPLTLIIEESRKVLIYGASPDWPSLVLIYFIGLIIATLGFGWFQKTRKGFADVL